MTRLVVSNDGSGASETGYCRFDSAGAHATALGVAKALIALRRGRQGAGLPRLFADPAWDMLLDLFVAKCDGRLISVSSLCIASGVPQSTAHRWIQALVDEMAVRRRADPVDRRRIFVAIADEAFEALAAELLRHRDRMAQID